MCAIFGILGKATNLPNLIKMSEAQKYRGPDHFGYYLDNHISIGNNRLAK